MRRTLCIVCLTAVLAAAGYFLYGAVQRRVDAPDRTVTQSTSVNPGLFNETNAFDNVRDFIAVGRRVSGTDGAANAAEFIVSRLKKYGLKPDITLFTDDTPVGKLMFRNVLATIDGNNDDLIVLVSHFDTKLGLSGKFTGANDSGSSTGLLLEMARVLKGTTRSGPSIMLAFVDGEECRIEYSPIDGFHGSRNLAARLNKQYGTSRIRGVIVVDMIGDKNLNVMIPMNSAHALAPLVLDSAREENQRAKFSLCDAVGDDHVSFMAQGIPAVDLIDFEYGSAPGKNDYWHTQEDTLDKLSPESLGIVGRVVIRMINKLSAQPAKK